MWAVTASATTKRGRPTNDAMVSAPNAALDAVSGVNLAG